MITIPVGALAGGLVAGYDLMMMIRNLLPIILFAVLIVAGLVKFPMKMIKGFKIFGDLIVAMITAALVCAII